MPYALQVFGWVFEKLGPTQEHATVAICRSFWVGAWQLFNWFESGFSKRFEWLLDERDSNPYSTDSNLNSSKLCFDGLIRISSKRLESLVKKEVKLKATDSYHIHRDLNPSWRTNEEIEEQIRIPYIAIRIHEYEVMKDKERRFESSSYGFESLLKLKLKVEG